MLLDDGNPHRTFCCRDTFQMADVIDQKALTRTEIF
jgi:hypothetical protein